jgi:hypothetical protein
MSLSINRRNGNKRNGRNRQNLKQTVNKQKVGASYQAPFYKVPGGMMVPESLETELKFVALLVVTNAAGFAASTRYSSNAYDVDPSVGSTAMAGFAEFAAFYKKFRTLSMSYKFNVQNAEAFGVTIMHGFSTTSIASGSLSFQYSTNPLFQTSALGPATGFGIKTFRGNASICKIYGTETPLYDDLFTGSTTSSTLATASTAWCYLGLISNTALTALGVLVTAEIKLRVQFYGRNLLLV